MSDDWKKKTEIINKILKKNYDESLKKPRTYKDSQHMTLGPIGLQYAWVYTGEVKGRFPDGLGKASFTTIMGDYVNKDAVIYEGEFIGGEPNGKGKLIINEKDGQCIYETYSIKLEDGKTLEGKFKSIDLEATGYFKYQLIKNNKLNENGKTFIFKDQKTNEECPFKEMIRETRISGDMLNTFKLHYDKHTIFKWKSVNYEMEYKGDVRSVKDYQWGPVPNGIGQMTSYNLNPKSEFYQRKQTMVGNFNNWMEDGYIKRYVNNILIEEGNYSMGKRNGLVKFYNEEGNVVEEVNFKNGVEQKK